MTEWTKISWKEAELIQRLSNSEHLNFSEYLMKVYEDKK